MAVAAVVQILKDDAGVGAVCADRIYFGIAPAKPTALPYAVVNEVSVNTNPNKLGEKFDIVRVLNSKRTIGVSGNPKKCIND